MTLCKVQRDYCFNFLNKNSYTEESNNMKATEAKFLGFIKKSPQFVIPIYQRAYSWTERECRQLWDDIVRTDQNDEIAAHFIGSIVYIEKGLYQVTSQSPLLVIDGQQRLTTMAILIAAVVKALEKLPEENREPIEGFSPRKLCNYYLINPEEEDERYYKLILSQTDKDSLIAVVTDKELPKEYSRRIKENYELFQSWLEEFGGDLATVCKGIAKLVVVDIALSRDQDNPQLIFESMNSDATVKSIVYAAERSGGNAPTCRRYVLFCVLCHL